MPWGVITESYAYANSCVFSTKMQTLSLQWDASYQLTRIRCNWKGPVRLCLLSLGEIVDTASTAVPRASGWTDTRRIGGGY